ncbi:hypothetical protein EVAR_81106_1 [Eumeta japonica]|uniref:Uncharacterized protein n=1 Tax=Eumeta variegata TaxID=151549 RepID=A0A4C1T6S9_EUMVA|nr:hypothetical protein EVAR_81106_1 [Eumeta japonica]
MYEGHIRARYAAESPNVLLFSEVSYVEPPPYHISRPPQSLWSKEVFPYHLTRRFRFWIHKRAQTVLASNFRCLSDLLKKSPLEQSRAAGTPACCPIAFGEAVTEYQLAAHPTHPLLVGDFFRRFQPYTYRAHGHAFYSSSTSQEGK